MPGVGPVDGLSVPSLAGFHFRVWPDLGGDLGGDLRGGLCIFKGFWCAHLRIVVVGGGMGYCIYFLYISLVGFLGVDINGNLPIPSILTFP